MKFKTLTLLACLLVSTHTISAQKGDIEAIDTFFNVFKVNPIGAIDTIFSSSIAKSRDQARVEYIKNEIKITIDQIGNFKGYKILTNVNTSENEKILGCIVSYDKKPLRFVFKLNKMKSKWQIENFKFDENVDEEFEKSKKIAGSKEKQERF